MRPGDARASAALVVDLSLAGACIESTEALAPGVLLTLEIIAPTLWDPLVLRANVVWSSAPQGRLPGRIGVHFAADEPGQLFALFEVLAAHAYE
jgi:hypothetical protein